eukprot:SAG11_NODE_9598_length_897_cov_0.959900_1_plen_139_part_10
MVDAHSQVCEPEDSIFGIMVRERGYTSASDFAPMDFDGCRCTSINAGGEQAVRACLQRDNNAMMGDEKRTYLCIKHVLGLLQPMPSCLAPGDPPVEEETEMCRSSIGSWLTDVIEGTDMQGGEEPATWSTAIDVVVSVQ